jgi:hypothetical protein
VKPEIILVGSDHYVRVQADRAVFLREHLLNHGVPCAPPVPSDGSYHAIRLGGSANLGMVQALLDRWGPPDAP